MKRALVTGAAGGLGQAFCRAFREEGYRVVGTDVKHADGEWDAFVEADLECVARDDRERGAILARLRAAIDGGRLDVLVNNAALQVVAPVRTLPVAELQRSLDTNLVAPFALIQALLPELERAKGSVVNVASIHAVLTKPGFAAYAISKAALVGLTRSLAVDLAGAVRVNAVCPAATHTPMLAAGFEGRPDALAAVGACHPLGRIARPEEVAAAAVYLASDAAAFVNGTALDVDGGIGARLHDPPDEALR